VEIATLVREISPGENIFNPNHPKVILDSENNAIYFSRSAIPYIRDSEPEEWASRHVYYKHLGLYAYRTDVLSKITRLPESSLEKAESLEQNRWIENGFKIRAAITKWESIGIDTPEDVKRAMEYLENFS
jgi:3-deoxy-manno-octulosonate cytidylyltransferase (CMP-KDO synthetase)